jgi:GNAT superfamily N-acetyltransferase
MPALEHRHGSYLVSDDPARLDVAAIHAYLTRSYWCEGIPPEVVQRSVQNSLCIGAYMETGAQVGLTRFVTDFATFCYVCDVYVLEEHRRHGLSKAMLALAVAHPRLQGLRRWCLMTRDAQGLYSRFGFENTKHPQRYMERLDREVYNRAKPSA